MAAEPKRRWTETDYLTYEREHPEKHEYHAGEVLAMAGASRAHGILCKNLAGSLYNQLRGRPCEMFIGDMRVRVSAWNSCLYPDLVIVCGEERYADDQQDTLLNPTVIIEVLSPRMERYDRGEKFARCRALESLQEVLFVSQSRVHIERYQRQPDRQWLLSEASGREAALSLTAVEAALSLATVYEGVAFQSGEGDGPEA